jgi:hypothetical protein
MADVTTASAFPLNQPPRPVSARRQAIAGEIRDIEAAVLDRLAMIRDLHGRDACLEIAAGLTNAICIYSEAVQDGGRQ